jgi:hypothetical protein
MRYRALSPTGDYTFGQGPSEMLVDSPDAVAQAVQTRLQLWEGEWFLDLTEGTPYESKILGTNRQDTHDQAVQERILGTQGAASIAEYASVTDSDRNLTINATVNTVYGATTIQQVM